MQGIRLETRRQLQRSDSRLLQDLGEKEDLGVSQSGPGQDDAALKLPLMDEETH